MNTHSLTLLTPGLAAATPQVVPTLVAEIKTGVATSNPDELTVAGSQLFFEASDLASGRQAQMSASGTPSASAGSGFTVSASLAEGSKHGLFFFGTNGRLANPWGSGTSYQCVVPPVKRTPLISSTGTNGSCDGICALDFNALITAQPAEAPSIGLIVQIQCWFRDSFNTGNQATSLSDALEFTLCP